MKDSFLKLYFILICLSFISCIKKHKYTSTICNNKLYVEVYNVNPAGVNAEYLTDSINFKLYIGTFDEEHERYVYECKGDSVYIIKEQSGSKNCYWRTLSNGTKTIYCDIDTLERKVYNLSELKKFKVFE